jgi:hypothetical protein
MEMVSCDVIYLLSIVMIGTGVIAISRFCLRNLRCSNVGITDGKIYEVRRCYGVGCHDIHTKFHKDSFRHSQVKRGVHIQTQTDRKLVS